jgi:hypothetical protein
LKTTPPHGSKIAITKNCTFLIDELEKYKWANPPRSGDQSRTDTPLKAWDHAIDAARYFFVSYYAMMNNDYQESDPVRVYDPDTGY